MKRVVYGMALTLGLTLVLGMGVPIYSGMMGQRPMGQPEGATEPSPSGMMGQGGQGSMGMMGPQLMQQMRRSMMGGGMGGQPQSDQQTAAMPQNLTQQDAQGPVTVEVTLLTPDKPRADGKLAVRVKLDTHAVALDQYQLDKLAVLRDAQGREISALGLESPSGSGHHRQGVLTFPGTDAGGKPVLGPEAKALPLILRGIGGVLERVFRWQLPLG